jgi:hypothetical protein
VCSLQCDFVQVSSSLTSLTGLMLKVFSTALNWLHAVTLPVCDLHVCQSHVPTTPGIFSTIFNANKNKTVRLQSTGDCHCAVL